MAEKVYIMVTTRRDKLKAGDELVNTRLDSFTVEDTLMKAIAHIATVPEDTREIERIFTVDIYGDVTYYEIMYVKGKLKLEKRDRNEGDINDDPEGEWTF
jgi:hypothetical protein